jgi:hypothetical protein
MSDRFSAYIMIGGRLPKRQVPDLLKAITNAGVSFEWGECILQPTTEAELLQARHKGKIFLCDAEARYGEFPELEQACRTLGLPYTLYSEGKYEYDPLLTDWRPGMKKPLFRRSSNSNEAIYVPANEVKKAFQHLEAGRVGKAKVLLRSLCPEVPKLPPFTII